MVILENNITSNVVLIFGLGLIGHTILERIPEFSRHHMPFTWQSLEMQVKELKLIENKLHEIKARDRLDLVWSAGKGGFFSEDRAFQDEFMSFNNIISWVTSILSKNYNHVHLHLLSSAGGLFEGQILVDKNSMPKALRPYGAWKLRQENLAKNLLGHAIISIYRPSTVYGYHPGARIGLVANLLKKGYCNQFVEIFASKSALRDYIFVENIADFIIKNIQGFIQIKREEANVFFLVSGKSSNILEICKIVSDILNKPLLNSYRIEHQNTDDNTYSPNIKPSELQVVSLVEGIKKINMMKYF